MSVFVDTSAWYASMVPSDPRHQLVLEWLRSNTLPLITSEFVADETLTLMRARGENLRARTLGRQLFDLDLYNLFEVNRDRVRRAWQLFRDQPARRWSFTDCTSKVLMDDLHLHKALTFDHHFAEFGNVQVLP